METTLAATPRALATGTPQPFSHPGMPHVPQPVSTLPLARQVVMPQNPHPVMHTRPHRPPHAAPYACPPERIGTTVRKRRHAPGDAFVDGTFSFLSRAWFFIAGTTMGILFAAALVALVGGHRAIPRRHVVATNGSARALVITRPALVAARSDGVTAALDNETDAGESTTSPAAAQPASGISPAAAASPPTSSTPSSRRVASITSIMKKKAPSPPHANGGGAADILTAALN